MFIWPRVCILPVFLQVIASSKLGRVRMWWWWFGALPLLSHLMLYLDERCGTTYFLFHTFPGKYEEYSTVGEMIFCICLPLSWAQCSSPWYLHNSQGGNDTDTWGQHFCSETNFSKFGGLSTLPGTAERVNLGTQTPQLQEKMLIFLF